ncbi:MAG TPA: ribbon-helix-helix domain-containing protein [Deltaproteobacteria bacterium]|nr:ribbon-helix-helix domain-containing protein [Deltaproteobacteria bacterium]HOM29820.1 ribbon-helix-helix domain-containing protein [Deltaproteobacteria bacterium]HPP79389.1 ribbon-helix-helix domain-containing protein [Deltaproteobacteria bacterium]
MTNRGRKPLRMKQGELSAELVKRNYYIDERYAKALSVLSALTGKELSILVNEALQDLIAKYQPSTEIDLLNIKPIKK